MKSEEIFVEVRRGKYGLKAKAWPSRPLELTPEEAMSEALMILRARLDLHSRAGENNGG